MLQEVFLLLFFHEAFLQNDSISSFPVALLERDIQWNFVILFVYSHIQHFQACNIPSSLKNQKKQGFLYVFQSSKSSPARPWQQRPRTRLFALSWEMSCMVFNSISFSTAWVLAVLATVGRFFVVLEKDRRFGYFHCSCSTSEKKEMWGSETTFKQTSFILRIGWTFEGQQLKLHCSFNVIIKQ